MKNESNDKCGANRERYVDIKKVSRYTSLPVKTIYDWSNQGKFPCIKYGRRILFDIQDVDKAMANLKQPYLQCEKTVNKIIGDLHGNGI
ncbi:transcriptional regulator [Candidatus Scalindua japonica]|uniref:Transcriptional regulator n=1 Tax=Candidatus Scalindua japonica TaxID=1284222 RepID=A0A286U0K2_9BACT|nr:helix-turn-helix domain-containing protein [Candidatus Scalindua japonica]GAX61638.1 transcriptional regulator [Candidatus Scalindua japonica]